MLEIFKIICETKNMRHILSKLTKAVKEFDLIHNGDTVAVGLSGGKDSLLLLSALSAFKKTKMIDFNLIAITIDFGRNDMDYSPLAKFCENLRVPFYLEPSQIYDIVFNIRKEKNPCSLCAKMRRGALCEAAKKHGANLVALGHHSNDLVETFMLSLLYEGRVSTFNPKSFMSRSNVMVIRPLIYVTEEEVLKYLNKNELPVVFNPCPANKHTKRQYVKDLIAQISQDVPCAPNNLSNAIIKHVAKQTPPPSE